MWNFYTSSLKVPVTPKLIFSLLKGCYECSSFAKKLCFWLKRKILEPLELADIAILLGTRPSEHLLPPPQALVVSWEGNDFERACGIL
jgi:hypothetical protein